MTLFSKILFASVLGFSQILLAELKLTDDTNPKNLAECIDKVGVVPSQSPSAEQKLAITDCINRDYAEGNRPTNAFCKNKLSLINEQNLRFELEEVCNKKYYETILCLAVGKNLKKRFDEENDPAKKAKNEKSYKDKVDRCVTENARYMVGDYCVKYLQEVGMQKDASLLAICVEKAINPKEADSKANGP